MANLDNPRGFRPIGANLPGLMKFNVDASNATSIGVGDPIIMEAGGNVARAAAGSGVAVVAVAMSIKDSTGAQVTRLPTSTAGTIMGMPVNGVKFIVQLGTGHTGTQADVFATCDLIVGNCDTTTGLSVYELDGSDLGTGSTFRILGLSEEVDNEWGEHANVFGIFTENAFYDATTV